MSWCRFGSPCTGTMPTFKDDVECTPGGKCPGSDLYIFDSTSGGIECCFCRLFPKDDFVAQTQEEMIEHIEAHVAAGHHVRPSLRRGAKRELTDDWAKLMKETEHLRSTSAPTGDPGKTDT